MKNRSALIALAGAQFVMVLDQTVMGVSISHLVADFNTTVTSQTGPTPSPRARPHRQSRAIALPGVAREGSATHQPGVRVEVTRFAPILPWLQHTIIERAVV